MYRCNVAGCSAGNIFEIVDTSRFETARGNLIYVKDCSGILFGFKLKNVGVFEVAEQRPTKDVTTQAQKQIKYRNECLTTKYSNL